MPQGAGPIPREWFSLPLTEARPLLRERQRELARARTWKPVAYTSTLPQPTTAVGVFAPFAAGDEPTEMPAQVGKVPHAYPRCVGNTLEFHLCSAKDLVLNAQLRVQEAPASAPAAQPDVLLVPALLCDRRGNRIGRGRGFYDSYLRAHPHTRAVALVHSDSLVDALPEQWTHAGDVRVDGVITETSTLSFEGARKQ